MAYKCAHCKGTHEKAAEARVCAGLTSTPTVAPAPVRTEPTASQPMSTGGRSQVIHRDSPPTDPQLDKARRLGINLNRAWKRGPLGDEIDRVIAEREGRRVTQSVPEPPKTKVPLDMLQKVGDGYFAVRLDANRPHTFFRLNLIKPIKNTRRKLPIGTFTVETLHGDNRRWMLTIFPDGRVREYDLAKEDELLMVCVDPNGGRIEYGIQIGSCGVCGKTLTDERSRWYGIGPDCEKRNGHLISIVENKYGPWRAGYTHKDRLAEGK